MKKILFLEDDQTISEVTSEYLMINGYDVHCVYDGKKAIENLAGHKYDIAILDIMVPGISGLEVLKYIQTHNIDMVTIMLTAISNEKVQLEAFSKKVDDYIIKPFSPLILIKRIEAIFRRVQTEVINDKGVFVDEEGYQVYWVGKPLHLTYTEFLIFKTLYAKQSRVFSRENLLDIIAADDFMVSDRVVDAHIKNLRKKLPLNMIKTIMGIGYQWNKEYLDEDYD